MSLKENDKQFCNQLTKYLLQKSIDSIDAMIKKIVEHTKKKMIELAVVYKKLCAEYDN